MTWQANNLDKDKHCFFGSTGGFSSGKYAGLNANIKSNDDKKCLMKNLQEIENFENYLVNNTSSFVCFLFSAIGSSFPVNGA